MRTRVYACTMQNNAGVAFNYDLRLRDGVADDNADGVFDVAAEVDGRGLALFDEVTVADAESAGDNGDPLAFRQGMGLGVQLVDVGAGATSLPTVVILTNPLRLRLVGGAAAQVARTYRLSLIAPELGDVRGGSAR